MSMWGLINLPDSASPVMEEMIYFHDFMMMIIIMILIFVGSAMIKLILNSFTNRFSLSNEYMEMFWILSPAVILLVIGGPSLNLLYLMDEMFIPELNIKVMGFQWYWNYSYSDLMNQYSSVDSYMGVFNSMDQFRLLDVDYRLVLPVHIAIRSIITSSDVIHAWTVPALGIKVDAVPGRLNQISFMMNRVGIFYGQCSEICGMNHSFMPIVIESVIPSMFIKYMKM